jgi:hypothetical protein
MLLDEFFRDVNYIFLNENFIVNNSDNYRTS